MCVNLKNIWLWAAVDLATKRLVVFKIGTREAKFSQKPTDKIRHIDAKFYASDHWHAYKLIDQAKHLTEKAHTYTVERMDRLLRDYLARLARKTYCYSKSLQMIKYSISLFMHRDFIEYMVAIFTNGKNSKNGFLCSF